MICFLIVSTIVEIFQVCFICQVLHICMFGGKFLLKLAHESFKGLRHRKKSSHSNWFQEGFWPAGVINSTMGHTEEIK